MAMAIHIHSTLQGLITASGERFRLAAELELQPDDKQVTTPIYMIGDEAEDVKTSLNLTDQLAGE